MASCVGSRRPQKSRNSPTSPARARRSPCEAGRTSATAQVFSQAMAEVIEAPSGLEGVVAFRTSIAEPDKEGGALRYRGVDIDDLVGQVPFEKVWGLLVDGSFDPGMPPATPYPLPARTGDTRVDVQAALAQLAPAWGFKPLLDIDDEEARDNLARSSVMALSFVAQSARGDGKPPVPEADIDRATSIPERFLI